MEIQNYLDKTLLGWIYYNENYSQGDNSNSINRVCYVYPRYILEDDDVAIPIDPQDFPMLGSFEVRIQGGFSAEDVVDKLTHLVKAKLNIIPEEETDQQNNHYRLKFNPTYSQKISEVWLEKFDDNSFYQVVRTDLSFDDILKRKSIDYFLDNIYTQYIFIKNKEGFFGPFDYYIDNNQVQLSATSKYDYNILKPNPAIISKEVLRVGDRADNGVDLIMSKSIDEAYDVKDSYDFITDSALLDKILSIFEDRKSIDRNQIKDLKRILFTQIDPDKYPNITETRLQRLKELLKKSEFQNDFLSRISYYLMEDEDNQDFVLRKILDTRFEELEERSTRFIEVREKLDELNREKNELENNLDVLKNEVNNAKEFIIKENKELSEKLQGEIDNLENEKKNLISDIEHLTEVKDLADIDDKLKSSIEKNRDIVLDLDKTKNEILTELKQGIDDFDHKGKIIGLALKERGFNDVISTIRGTKNFTYNDFKDIEYADFNSKDEIIDYVFYKMNQIYKHRISRNGVINLLVLLSENFIINFDGKTGSGKTSRAEAFLNALGLNYENNHLVRVDVDPDIRTIRDLIGYFNPNTGEIVKNNRRIFNLLEAMEKNEDNELSCILFDNVNASIPEHFLSSLLDKCIDRETYVNLGGGKELKIKNPLRIVTTITDDHTGFVISNRYYDKTVTSRQVYDGRSVFKPNNIEFEEKGAVSYSDILKFSEKKIIPGEFDSKFNSIISLFRKNGSYISSRAEEKAVSYMESTHYMMDLTSPLQKLLPIELAISQFILPNLNIESMNDRFFSTLLSELKNMPLLEARFNEIRANKEKVDVDSRLDF